MITLLYNLDTQTPGEFRRERYTVDGKTGMFPSNYVELIYQEPEKPTFDEATQKIEYSDYYANLDALLWTRDANIVQKTQEEIDQYQKNLLQQQKEKTFQDAIQIGYLIPNTQIYLGLGDKDRAAWNQLITLINELMSLGQMLPTTPITLTDKNGAPHVFQASEAKVILAGLGMYYYDLWTQRNSVS